MNLFLIALGVVCAIAAVLFGAIFSLLIPFSERSEAASLALALAALPPLALPATAEFLERETARRSLAAGKPASMYDFRKFQMAWPLATLYGWLVLIALDLISTGIVNDATLLWEGPEEAGGDVVKNRFLLALAINFPALMLGAYLVGRWIGTRCSPRGLVTVLLVVVLLTGTAIGLTELMPAEMYDRAFVFLNLLELPFVLLCGLLGYWRGRKARWAKYVSYLLSVLPPETRDAMVELAFAEAQKVTEAPHPTAGSQPA